MFSFTCQVLLAFSFLFAIIMVSYIGNFLKDGVVKMFIVLAGGLLVVIIAVIVAVVASVTSAVAADQDVED